MIGYTYIRCLLIIILSYSGLATEDTNTQNVQKIVRSNVVTKNEDKNHERNVYEEHYRDVNSANYDQDYYPYRPYLDESNDEESVKDKGRTSGMKRITKRKESKEKYFAGKEESSKNNLIRLRSHKKSKTNLKAKLKRSAEIEGRVENKEKLFNSDEESYLPGAETMKAINSADASDLFPKIFDLEKNYTNSLTPRESNYHPPYNLKTDYDDNLQISDDKISPEDYLRIFNSSEIDLDEANDDNNNEDEKRIVMLSPEEFNLKSLSEALGEPIKLKHEDFPKCPVKDYEIMKDQDLSEKIKSDENKEILNQREEIKNVYRELLDHNYLKQDLLNAERNAGSDGKSVGDVRPKREQKVKTITLTFPILENLDSLITSSKKGTNETIIQKIMAEKDIKKSATERILSMGKLGPIESSSCVQDCTTECSETSFKCVTTIPSTFKELNEGNKLVMDLTDYVASIVNSSSLVDNKSLKDKIILADSGAIIPISLRKIIRLKPHNEIKRSNENEDDSSQDIYLVELLKEPNVKDSALALQSPKMIFSIPYLPRAKRQNQNVITNKM